MWDSDCELEGVLRILPMLMDYLRETFIKWYIEYGALGNQAVILMHFDLFVIILHRASYS